MPRLPRTRRSRPHAAIHAFLIGASVVALLALCSPHASAASLEREAAEGRWLFPPGRVTLGLLAGGGLSTAHKVRDANLLLVFPRVGYVLAQQEAFLPGSLEVVGELSYLVVFQERTSQVFGLAPLLKYNFWTGTRVTPFVEGGGGVTYATIAVPETGTNFNFSAQVGLGAHFALAERVTLDFRTVYHHLSNANISDSNPALNSASFSVGVSFLY
ncbi:MAG: acyloxyacyl hydrolase [Candidatus Methylomirabilales bacterium]